jgi:hypothetical protein
VLPDLGGPDIFFGPIWGYFPIVEIQNSIASILELPVEGLAGDFLGVRVRFILLDCETPHDAEKRPAPCATQDAQSKRSIGACNEEEDRYMVKHPKHMFVRFSGRK